MAYALLLIAPCIPFFFIAAIVLILNAIRSGGRFSLRTMLIATTLVAVGLATIVVASQ
jgi:hypothetical protein